MLQQSDEIIAYYDNIVGFIKVTCSGVFWRSKKNILDYDLQPLISILSSEIKNVYRNKIKDNPVVMMKVDFKKPKKNSMIFSFDAISDHDDILSKIKELTKKESRLCQTLSKKRPRISDKKSFDEISNHDTKEKDIYDLNEKRWSDFLDLIKEKNSLNFSDIPWPTLVETKNGSFYPTIDKMNLHSLHLRWHPDKFQQKFLSNFSESHDIRKKVMKHVTFIDTSINLIKQDSRFR